MARIQTRAGVNVNIFFLNLLVFHFVSFQQDNYHCKYMNCTSHTYSQLSKKLKECYHMNTVVTAILKQSSLDSKTNLLYDNHGCSCSYNPSYLFPETLFLNSMVTLFFYYLTVTEKLKAKHDSEVASVACSEDEGPERLSDLLHEKEKGDTEYWINNHIILNLLSNNYAFDN